MRGWSRLFGIVGVGALFVNAACAAVVPIIWLEPALTHGKAEAFGAIAVILLAIAVVAWWMFRKLQQHRRRDEARAVSIMFAMFTPVSFVAGVLLSQIPAGYAGLLLGGRFTLAGMFTGILAVTWLLSFAACAFALWITRRTKGNPRTVGP
jgi:cbb3-type cytochrome oxidase subunit 3